MSSARAGKTVMGIVLASLAVRCSLVVDTDGLSDAPPSPRDASVDATVAPNDAAPTDAVADVNGGDAADASVPDGAAVWSANGHAYLVVAAAPRITWNDARDHAVAAGGHLVTIASIAENDFVFALASANDAAWYLNTDYDVLYGPWIGGYQPDGSTEPAGGWTWVTGEPFSFTVWSPGEPSNSAGTENVLQFFGNTDAKAATWNDVSWDYAMSGYVVEFE